MVVVRRLLSGSRRMNAEETKSIDGLVITIGISLSVMCIKPGIDGISNPDWISKCLGFVLLGVSLYYASMTAMLIVRIRRKRKM